jgi:hypothetical protein
MGDLTERLMELLDMIQGVKYDEFEWSVVVSLSGEAPQLGQREWQEGKSG